MSYFSIDFINPWLLLVIIPAIALALWPYLRLPKKHRRMRNRVVPTILHVVILCICVLLLSGLNFQKKETTLRSDIIILADLSNSNVENKELVDGKIKEIIDESNGKYQIGIVVFAENYLYAAKMSYDVNKVYDDYLKADLGKLDDSATNIANALKYTSELLDEPKKGRIIILSDGLETDGYAIAEAKKMMTTGVKIDAIFFDSTVTKKEIQINEIIVQPNAAVGDQISIKVLTQSFESGECELVLYRNDEEIGRQKIKYAGSTNEYTFSYVIEDANFATITAELVDTAGDTIEQNNNYFSFIKINQENRLLLIEGVAGEGDYLYQTLSEEYDITMVAPQDAPETVSELTKYAEIIMMNVDVRQLPNDFDTNLEAYVDDYGGGLLTLGGENTYFFGGMKDTVYESIMPINVDKPDRPLAIMLVLDISSSMQNHMVPGTQSTRLAVAKDAAIKFVTKLRTTSPGSYVGVTVFAGQNDWGVPVRLSPVNNPGPIVRKINEITAKSGTYYNQALSEATRLLTEFKQLQNKHIIFISDGEPTGGADVATQNTIYALVDNLVSKGISLSTIGFNATTLANTILETMAEKGKGRFYQLSSNELEKFLTEETTVAQTLAKYDVDPFIPITKINTPLTKDVIELPTFGGYVTTTAKLGADTILSYSNGDPIYVQWEYNGSGKVGSFTSTFSGDGWSEGLYDNETNLVFIKNMINGILSTTTGSDLIIDFENNNYTTIVRITCLGITDSEYVTATLIDPTGKEISLELQKVGLSTFAAPFESIEKGVYQVTAFKKSGDSTLSHLTVYTTFSYSAEYNKFTNISDGEAYLLDICSVTATGEMLTSENLFTEGIITLVDVYNPQLPLIVAAITLFLLDIIARKFKFKWPHEWFSKKKIDRSTI